MSAFRESLLDRAMAGQGAGRVKTQCHDILAAQRFGIAGCSGLWRARIGSR